MAAPSTYTPDHKLWEYNLFDCFNTRQVRQRLQEIEERDQRTPQVAFEMALFRPVLDAMIRGVRVDLNRKKEMVKRLEESISVKESRLERILGQHLNFSSPKQMQQLFYGDFQLPQQRNMKTFQVSADEKSLQKATKNEPILRWLVDEISQLRSLYVFLRTFAGGEIDSDGRIRCAFNPAGATTFRFTSRKSIWRTGFNFQNVPKGDDKLGLPNIREFFIPDDGWEFWDGDLSRADLYVVAAEAEEEVMLAALQKRVDLHVMNAFVLAGWDLPPLEELVEGGHEMYPKHRARAGKRRQLAKTWCHGKNYGGSDRTMAQSAGITVAESEEASKNYFGFFRGLRGWHDRTLDKLHSGLPIVNPYGFSTRFFGEPAKDLAEALAWVPQSTVGLHINRIWIELYNRIPSSKLQTLIQVHDSLAGQFCGGQDVLNEMERIANSLPIPYDHIPGGLNIPWTPKAGKNWGEACA